jgi:hypothetical protein
VGRQGLYKAVQRLRQRAGDEVLVVALTGDDVVEVARDVAQLRSRQRGPPERSEHRGRQPDGVQPVAPDAPDDGAAADGRGDHLVEVPRRYVPPGPRNTYRAANPTDPIAGGNERRTAL